MTNETSGGTVVDIIGDGVAALISERVEAGEWCAGFQVAVDAGPLGRSVRSGGIDGVSDDVTDTSMFAVYCAGKPVTAVVVGTLIDAGELSFDDRVGDIVDVAGNGDLAAVTVADVLSHRAGLGGSHGAAYLMMPTSVRTERVLAHRPERESLGMTFYSEFVGWEVLRAVIEAVADREFVDVVRDVLSQADISDVWLTPPFDSEAKRVSVNVHAQDGRLVPLLWETSQANLADARAASGVYASMAGLAGLYRAVLDARLARSEALLSQDTATLLTTATTPSSYDPVLSRECTFSLGFMAELQQHRFSARHDQGAFGHSGLSGMTCAAADPARDLTYAVHLNTVTDADPESAEPASNPELRRKTISEHILHTYDTVQRGGVGM